MRADRRRVLLPALPATAGPLQDDLAARRAHAMDRLGPEAMAVLWSAPTRVYSLDVDYEYRQDSNFLYLTGIEQPDSILVLMPGNATRREILFVREADARREHWEGHSLTPSEASAASGIATVMLTTAFEPFVAAMLSRRPMGATDSEYEKFFTALIASRAQVSMLLEPQPNLASEPGPTRQFGASGVSHWIGMDVHDVGIPRPLGPGMTFVIEPGI
jgi:Xaa-Pro aminopeptidase